MFSIGSNHYNITSVTVNMGWNTGFSIVTDLNKGCSLLTMRKLNVYQGVCSSVRLDTDIFIGTSVLNCQTLKTLFLHILVMKTIFSRKLGGIHFFYSTCGQNMSLYGKILLPKTVTLGANLLVVIAKCFITLINYSQDEHLIVRFKY